MPERFYDPEFTQRVVRLLRLKGGRAPQDVADEIVPVLDLSSLFSAAANELPSGVLNERDAASVAGRFYSRYYGPNIAAVAGSVHVSQFLNPIGSGRRIFITSIQTWGIANQTINGRFSTVAFGGLATLSARTPFNLKPSAEAAVLQFRFQVFLQAGFPPAGIGGVVYLMGPTTGFNLIQGPTVVALEPGEGFICHHAGTPAAPDADPLPDTFAQTYQMQHMEFPIA